MNVQVIQIKLIERLLEKNLKMVRRKSYYALMYYKEEWILEKLELLFIMVCLQHLLVNLKKKGIDKNYILVIIRDLVVQEEQKMKEL